MEIKVLKEDNENLNFVLKDTDYVYVNTLRIIMLSEIPILAIKSVKFIKNTSALFDEAIAHRLGLLPLTTDLKGYEFKENCKCKGKGCARCQLKFILEAKGPCIVYAENLKSRDSKIIPVYPKMPIVKLLKGQTLQIEAVARLGKGKEHAKFAPGLVYYRAVADIKTSTCQKPEEIAKICPKNVFKVEDKKLKIVDELACDLCLACVEASKNDIKVEDKKDEFIITIESWGQLDIKKIVDEGISEFNSKLKELDKNLG